MSTPGHAASPQAAAPRHAALVLAAGSSRRLGTSKQTLLFDGETLLHRAARIAIATAPAQALVVLARDALSMRAAIADLDVDIVACDDAHCGQSASLRAGVSALARDIDGVLVLLCDQVHLDVEHACGLLRAWRTDPARAVASAYSGVIGVPAVLPRAWFEDVLRLDGDRGARELLRLRESDVVQIAAPALAQDVDTPRQARKVTRTYPAE
jgi:molybdenum cofactor cytidylyltransferase